MREQPDYGPGLCILGMIDAALGRKEDAIREGRRAVELLPVTKDSMAGASIMEYLGIIYACTGEKDLALAQVAATIANPQQTKLRLSPPASFLGPVTRRPALRKTRRLASAEINFNNSSEEAVLGHRDDLRAETLVHVVISL
ncbi:MAG: hypothetical protein M3N48_12510 [Verrucomicrobiota bacterium]|nr:hypothetical protein [Verrucomicrobiota bacterium]